MLTAEEKLNTTIDEMEGGTGRHLTQEEKILIRDGKPNNAENRSPYNLEKMLEIGDDIMNRYPIQMFADKHV